jgi:DsbC/DsbD-like thiol-disulfide interchange protein
MKRSFPVHALHTLLFISVLFECLPVLGQEDPVHWEYSAVKGAGKTYVIHMTATLNDGWHIYAQVQPKAAISEPTKISFTRNPLVAVHGKVKEVGSVERQRLAEVGIEQNMFKKQVDFVQSVELKANVKASLSGTITYQACTDEMCLPPKTMPFSINLP